jgi:hypothetical protein
MKGHVSSEDPGYGFTFPPEDHVIEFALVEMFLKDAVSPGEK